MKKIKMLLAAIACIAISASAVAQGTVDLDKMSKEERKAYEAKQDSIEHVAAVDALKSGNWMLIAEQRDGKILSEREKPLNFLVVENNETILLKMPLRNRNLVRIQNFGDFACTPFTAT